MWKKSVYLLLFAAVCRAAVMEFNITTKWDSSPVDHSPVLIRLVPRDSTAFTMEVDAPFFNDPPGPTGPSGQPYLGLWNFEVVELFLANDANQYVEIEVGPWGHHIVLLLNGTRNAIRHSLPLELTCQRNGSTWSGSAVIPTSYLPPNVTRMNAYAIHGSGDHRVYEALYPTPQGVYPNPDFHRLEYFKPVDLSQIVSASQLGKLSAVWSDSLNGLRTYDVSRTWNGFPSTSKSTRFQLSETKDGDLAIKVTGPFYNDSAPNGPPGPFYHLWDYEVAEIFLLNDKDEYIEIELGPWGHHLVLLLNGYRNTLNHSYAISYDAQRSSISWSAEAVIPASYLPPKVMKMNAYTIHGTGDSRSYSSLYPAPADLQQPDFHLLKTFRAVDLDLVIKKNNVADYSDIWLAALSSSYEYHITRTWDNRTVDTDAYQLRLEWSTGSEFLIHVSGPFFNDPPSPSGSPGEPFYDLWDYEVVEVFLANDAKQYVEIELNPWGQHIVLLLNGVRQTVRHSLPLQFTSNRTASHWTGTARVPAHYLPPRVTKMNAYAIHGSGDKRTYQALYPVPTGQFAGPDFHRLDFFQPIDILGLVSSSQAETLSGTWNEALTKLRRFDITKSWNGVPLYGSSPHLELTSTTNGDLVISVTAPFYKDQAPSDPAGSLYGLWEYEVVELFLANDKNEYIEIELGPWGHYIVLLLKGYRNVLKHSYNIEYSASRQAIKWNGTAVIPAAYLPPKISKMNAYSIHGVGSGRQYSSLYPVVNSNVTQPDFHLLQYFKAVDLDMLLPKNAGPAYSSVWISALNIEFQIGKTWDNRSIDHTPVKISIKQALGSAFIAEVEAPLFNDPPAPNGPAGEPYYGLWDYEVVELFLANDQNQYVEIELSPWGQHIVLLLNGTRNTIRHSLPLEFQVERNASYWTGGAYIPIEYLPSNVTKVNAYAIHGSGNNRTYEALYPVPQGQFQNPDFHRLQYFQPIDLTRVVSSSALEKESSTWKESLVRTRTMGIRKLWNGLPTGERGTFLQLKPNEAGDLMITVAAPFYNDTPPDAEIGTSVPDLPDYEVVELFLANADNEYVEIALGPWGHHSVVLYNGSRSYELRSGYPVSLTVTRNGTTWDGEAVIPASYLPPKVSKLNAHSAHGVGAGRKVLSLYPVPREANLTSPDLHLLQYFKAIDLELVILSNAEAEYSDIWKEALNLLPTTTATVTTTKAPGAGTRRYVDFLVILSAVLAVLCIQRIFEY